MAKKAQGGGSRPAKIGERIRQELGGLFQSGFIRDERFSAAMVTVTEVEVSPDLQHATAFISIFPAEEKPIAAVLTALSLAGKALRRELGSRLALRHTPEIRFSYDASAVYGERIERVLKEIGRPADRTSSVPARQDVGSRPEEPEK